MFLTGSVMHSRGHLPHKGNRCRIGFSTLYLRINEEVKGNKRYKLWINPERLVGLIQVAQFDAEAPAPASVINITLPSSNFSKE